MNIDVMVIYKEILMFHDDVSSAIIANSLNLLGLERVHERMKYEG